MTQESIPRAPLGKMPLIDLPFKRVAMDLMGFITPANEKGHRYILTLVDYATRYPEQRWNSKSTPVNKSLTGLVDRFFFTERLFLVFYKPNDKLYFTLTLSVYKCIEHVHFHLTKTVFE